MNNLCAEVGWKSINHYGEQLCGDHVDVVDQVENSQVIVLADGLGSGIKASLLSNMTTTMALEFVRRNMEIVQSAEIIMDTLPVSPSSEVPRDRNRYSPCSWQSAHL